MLILSEINDRTAVYHSEIIRPRIDLTCLVTISGNKDKLNLYKITRDSLELLHSTLLEDQVLAFKKVQIFGHDILWFLDRSFQIGVIFINKDLSPTIRIVTKLASRGQSSNTDSPASIIPEKGVDPSFIAFSLFYGNIHILFLKNPLLDDILDTKTNNKKPQQKRKLKNLDNWWKMMTFPIGRVSGLQIISLSEPKSTLAILYQSIVSSHAVRYLQVSQETSDLTREFSPFEEQPNLIIPSTLGGHFAVTSSALFYFPDTQIKYLTIDKKIKDITLSTKSNEVFFGKSFISSNSSLQREVYTSYEIIDHMRILLVSESGKAYMLYIDMNQSSPNTIIVNQVTMIQLGDTTIPNKEGLHHITGDLFVQCSRQSRSVFFQVLPTKPNIHIKSFIESCPPILDIKCMDQQLYVCQGGSESSEFRKYSSRKALVETIASVKLNGIAAESKINGSKLSIQYIDAVYTTILNVSDLSVSNERIDWSPEVLDVYQDDTYECIVKESCVLENGKTSVEDTFIYAKSFRDISTVLAVSELNKLYLFSERDCLTFSDSFINTADSYDIVKLDESNYLIALRKLDGQYNILEIGRQDTKLLYSGEAKSSGRGIIMIQEKDNIVVFIPGSKLLQLHFKMGDGLELVKSLQQNVDCYSMMKYGKSVIIVNYKDAAILERDLLSGFYVPYDLSCGDGQIFIISENKILLVSGDHVSKLDIKPEPSQRLISHHSKFSRNLFIKSLPIPNSNYIIGVVLDNSSEDETTELHLIDAQSFETKFVYKFSEDLSVVDICLVPHLEGENYGVDAIFMCLTSSLSTPLYMFGIQNSEIIRIKSGPLPGIELKEELRLNNISHMEENLFLVSGSIVLLLKLMANTNEIEWKVLPKSITASPAFIVAQSCTENEAYLIDALEGIFKATINWEDKHQIKLSPFGDTRNQGFTSIAVATSVHNKFIVAGDALGNVVLTVMDNFEEKENVTYKFNVGAQVNAIYPLMEKKNTVLQICVIGTLSGGLYLVNDQLDESIDLNSKASIAKLDYLFRSNENILQLDKTESENVINGDIITGYLTDLLLDPSNVTNKLQSQQSLLEKIHVESNSLV